MIVKEFYWKLNPVIKEVSQEMGISTVQVKNIIWNQFHYVKKVIADQEGRTVRLRFFGAFIPKLGYLKTIGDSRYSALLAHRKEKWERIRLGKIKREQKEKNGKF